MDQVDTKNCPEFGCRCRYNQTLFAHFILVSFFTGSMIIHVFNKYDEGKVITQLLTMY